MSITNQNELTQEETRVILAKATMAKIQGYSSFTGQFFDHQLKKISVTIEESREDLARLYKKIV